MVKKDSCDHCENSNEDMKKDYDKFRKMYNLPEFKSLNEDFDIGKIEYHNGTLLRDVRKMMVSKLASLLQFIELLLNPSNGSMFYMFAVRSIGESEKEMLNKLFESLGEIELESFYLDINYKERAEAEFIKKHFTSWQSMKKDLDKIIKCLNDGWRKSASKKERGYFG